MAAVLLAAALRALGATRVVVEGTSMRPTLEPGDRLLVVRTGRLRRGDLVAVADPRYPGRLLVKRAAEVNSGWVELRGDNPEASTDSREFGAVPVSEVRGRAVRRYAPSHRRGAVR
ncbi:MAG TPA: nickel-type superoxide dismutase maturation protease [Acidimicrobiaceae bacterium]|nr:nickel-type superoxide dismutase maturation protease [Acidimicrobiaceae bacterium]